MRDGLERLCENIARPQIKGAPGFVAKVNQRSVRKIGIGNHRRVQAVFGKPLPEIVRYYPALLLEIGVIFGPRIHHDGEKLRRVRV